VKTIGFFGSALRGEQSSKSDIDVLVEFRNPIGFFKFLELEEFLSEQLGGKVDLMSGLTTRSRSLGIGSIWWSRE
jgi:uncharacterized protein